MDVLVLDRCTGKTHRVVDEVLDYLWADPGHQAAVVVPTFQHGRHWLDRLARAEMERGLTGPWAQAHHRVQLASPRSQALRGFTGRVWAEDLDQWDLGIYDPILSLVDVATVTATPAPTRWP